MCSLKVTITEPVSCGYTNYLYFSLSSLHLPHIQRNYLRYCNYPYSFCPHLRYGLLVTQEGFPFPGLRVSDCKHKLARLLHCLWRAWSYRITISLKLLPTRPICLLHLSPLSALLYSSRRNYKRNNHYSETRGSAQPLILGEISFGDLLRRFYCCNYRWRLSLSFSPSTYSSLSIFLPISYIQLYCIKMSDEKLDREWKPSNRPQSYVPIGGAERFGD